MIDQVSGSSHCGVWGGVRSVPGIVGSVVGRRSNTGVRLGCLIYQKSHVIRVPELCAAPPKRCNSNDAISTFEIRVGELRATFLRNHNMRCHKDPKRKTTQAQQTEDPQAEDTPSPEDNPSGRHPKRKTTQAQKTPTTPTVATTARSTGALHPIRGTTPVTWRCTRYVALHPLRGGAPEQKRCVAYRSGAAPQQTRTNAELARRTTHRRTPPCAAGPYRWQDGHAAHATTCTPAHSDTSHTLTCEEPVFASVRWVAGLAETWKGRGMPKWPRWRKR